MAILPQDHASNEDRRAVAIWIDDTLGFFHGRARRVSDLVSDLAFTISFDFAPALVPLGPAIFIGVALFNGTAEAVPNDILRAVASTAVGAGFQGAGMRLSKTTITYYKLSRKDEAQINRFKTSMYAYIATLLLEIGAVWVIEGGEAQISLLVTFVVLVAALISVSKAMMDDVTDQSESAENSASLQLQIEAEDRQFEREEKRKDKEAARQLKRDKALGLTAHPANLRPVPASNLDSSASNLDKELDSGASNLDDMDGVTVPHGYTLPLDRFSHIKKKRDITDDDAALLKEMSDEHYRFALLHIGRSTRSNWSKSLGRNQQ